MEKEKAIEILTAIWKAVPENFRSKSNAFFVSKEIYNAYGEKTFKKSKVFFYGLAIGEQAVFARKKDVFYIESKYKKFKKFYKKFI